jgi:nucleotide-binding universal stress UspA family protein
MLPIHNILHPTDFSEQSQNALNLACNLAHDYAAQLVILHVANRPAPPPLAEGVLPPPMEDDHRALMDKLQHMQIPDSQVGVVHRLEEGNPATEILRVAEEIHPDVIIMGTHGRHGLSRLLHGSVAEQVVRKACCPVLTVKAPAGEAPIQAPVEESVVN